MDWGSLSSAFCPKHFCAKRCISEFSTSSKVRYIIEDFIDRFEKVSNSDAAVDAESPRVSDSCLILTGKRKRSLETPETPDGNTLAKKQHLSLGSYGDLLCSCESSSHDIFSRFCISWLAIRAAFPNLGGLQKRFLIRFRDLIMQKFQFDFAYLFPILYILKTSSLNFEEKTLFWGLVDPLIGATMGKEDDTSICRKVALQILDYLVGVRLESPEDSLTTWNMQELKILDHIHNGISLEAFFEIHKYQPLLLIEESSVMEGETTIGPFVLTESFSSSLNQLKLAMTLDCAILVEGHLGCGKTSLIHAAAFTENLQRETKCITVNMGEQSDSKALLGSYVCTDIPGEFKWHPGLITTAVKSGSWLIIEDIDLASMETLAMLVPLFSQKYLFIASRNETIYAAEGFRLFATRKKNMVESVTSSSSDFDRIFSSLNLYCIKMTPTKTSDIQCILSQKYPEFPLWTKRCISLYERQKECLSLVRNYNLGLADILKWMKRLANLHGNSILTHGNILLEAFDCFCGFVYPKSNRVVVMQKIGEILEIDPSHIRFFCENKYKPELQIENDGADVRVGRVCLPVIRNPSAEESKQKYAYTGLSLRLFEMIMTCVKLNEPVLLVGETGTGKTTMVQQICSLIGQKLVVLNMSQQTEGSELVGGYKPVAIKALAVDLKNRFEVLFWKTFSRSKNAAYLDSIRKSVYHEKWTRYLGLLDGAVALAKKKLTDGESLKKVDLFEAWEEFYAVHLARFRRQKSYMDKNPFFFSFVEGALVKALRNGEWILLDEVNLASTETLEILGTLLENTSNSLVLNERGDSTPIPRHQEFRVFACMNPATDVGKKDLPPAIRSRFTEVFVDEMDEDRADVLCIVKSYLSDLAVEKSNIIDPILDSYYDAKSLEKEGLVYDGANQRPHYSMRTLTRALTIAISLMKSSIQNQSKSSIFQNLYDGFLISFATMLNSDSFQTFEAMLKKHFKVSFKESAGISSSITNRSISSSDFIVTKTVERHLKLLEKALVSRKFPILLQGPTSSGKTSIVKYLAQATGHRFVRINNHEHTDVQEYLGNYVTDVETGKLVFREGILVEAVRKGYWIVLDELNLAPSEVLEALNRLLDDNRELYVSETQEMVKAHPEFVLFATQNPAGLYGGRKVLSRAFRNRFVEMHFDDMPASEMEEIISKKCSMAPSHCKKLIQVYKILREMRGKSHIFSGKGGFITLRDLFRWAERSPGDAQELAEVGYMILGERLRSEEEKLEVKKALEKVFRVTVNVDAMIERKALEILNTYGKDIPTNLIWTRAMKRLLVLSWESIKFDEPVLLVGETGVGKTSLCQYISALRNQNITIMNCHQHTETSDFLGAQRPTRNSESGESGKGPMFVWNDGPLVTAMKNGDLFLIDEISLAEDSVLERLNSVLEPSRTIVLTEMGTCDIEPLKSVDQFRILATMNPGGDFGKRELSPALRNRFTEIWVPAVTERCDLELILSKKLTCHDGEEDSHSVVAKMLDFIEWLKRQRPTVVSMRDLVAWAKFINHAIKSLEMNVMTALVHGACMVFLDSISDSSIRLNAIRFLTDNNESLVSRVVSPPVERFDVMQDSLVGVKPFYIEMKESNPGIENNTFVFNAPTTFANALRVLRAMQLSKPILLEGSPGVGKTSLISALAKVSGHKLVRINLSEQTDIMDLFGSDLPVEGSDGFAWRDGPFLKALRTGDWVLLDELNLASQSVLEGLNACLDHRGSVFIPELGRSFSASSKFKLFGAQNPLSQGGGRKGLPKSFLNRFSQVYVETLKDNDYTLILGSLYPCAPKELISASVDFVKILNDNFDKGHLGKLGGPWEFNLRDLCRWFDLGHSISYEVSDFVERGLILFGNRLRTDEDYRRIGEIMLSKFPGCSINFAKRMAIMGGKVRVGQFSVNVLQLCQSIRKDFLDLQILSCTIKPLETMMMCVENGWLSILVGSTGSGKTSCIRLLSQLMNQPLDEVYLNSGIDTTEILGGFEQRDKMRYKSELRICLMDLYVNLAGHVITNKSNDLQFCLSKILDCISGRCSLSSLLTVPKLVEQFKPFLERIGKIQEHISQAEGSRGKFEWIDGPIVKAAKEGRWLLLENVNLCSPSVLDRLNSLFENDGFLAINESGEHEVIVKPHPNFRVFMTYDPRYGEISRAMRNRGVEVHIKSLEYNDVCDKLRLARHSGFPGIKAAEWAFQQVPTRAKINDYRILHEIQYSKASSPDLLNSNNAWWMARDRLELMSNPFASSGLSWTLDRDLTFIKWFSSSPDFNRSVNVALENWPEKQWDFVIKVILEMIESGVGKSYLQSVKPIVGDSLSSQLEKFLCCQVFNGAIEKSNTASLNVLQQGHLFTSGKIKESLLSHHSVVPLFENISKLIKSDDPLQLCSDDWKKLKHFIKVAQSAKSLNEYCVVVALKEFCSNLPFETSLSLNFDKLHMAHKIWSSMFLPLRLKSESLKEIRYRLEKACNLLYSLKEAYACLAPLKWQISEVLASVHCAETNVNLSDDFILSVDDLIAKLNSEYTKFHSRESVKEDLKLENDVLLSEFAWESNHQFDWRILSNDYYLLRLGRQAIASFKDTYKFSVLLKRLLAGLKSLPHSFKPFEISIVIQIQWLLDSSCGKDILDSMLKYFDLLWMEKWFALSASNDAYDWFGNFTNDMWSKICSSYSRISVVDQNAFEAEKAAFVANILDYHRLTNLDGESLFPNEKEIVSGSRDIIAEALYILEPLMIITEDPAFAYRIGHDFWLEIVRDTQSEIFVREKYEIFISSRDYHPRIVDMRNVLEDALDKLADFETKLVKRRAGHDESILRKILADFSVLKSLIFKHKNLSSLSVEELNVIKSSILALKQRYNRREIQVREFEDVVGPLDYAVHKLMIGMEMVKKSFDSPFPTLLKNVVSGKRSKVNDVLPVFSKKSSSDIQEILLLISTGFFNSSKNAHSLEALRQLLLAILDNWGHMKQVRDKASAEESESVKYKMKNLKIDSIEEIEEEEMRSMFPSFQDDYGEVNSNSLTSTIGTNEMAQTDIDVSLVEYLEKWVLGQFSVSDLLFSVGKSFLKFSLDETGSECLVFGMTGVEAYFIKSGLVNVAKGPSSFYHDPIEMKRLNTIKQVLESLHDRLKKLLSSWPDHPVLNELLRICDRISRFPFALTSAMKYLTGLELILEKAQDWEDYAGKEQTLGDSLKSLTSLIVSLRKAEVDNWGNLLDRCQFEYRASSCKWIYHLLNVTIANQSGQDDDDGNSNNNDELDTSSNLISVLDEFLLTCKIGEFGYRLSLLKLIKSVLENFQKSGMAVKHSILVVLNNMISYYDFYGAAVNRHVEISRKPIESEIKKYAKVVSWKDVNIHALKQSSEKSHRTLSKWIRKFKECLEMPVSVIIQQLQAQVMKNDSGSSDIWKLEDRNGFTCNLSAIPPSLLTHDNDILSNLPKYHSKMIKILSKATSQVQGDFSLGSFSTFIEDHISLLQSYSVAEEESDKPGFSKRVKQKALSDFLKKLTSLGLSSRVSGAYASHFSNEHILSRVSVKSVDKCEHYFWKSFHQLKRLRDLASGENAETLVGFRDLPPAQIKSFVGFTEHMHLMCTGVRECRSVSEQCSDRSLKIIQNLKTLGEIEGKDLVCLVKNTFYLQFDDLQCQFTSLKVAEELLMQYLEHDCENVVFKRVKKSISDCLSHLQTALNVKHALFSDRLYMSKGSYESFKQSLDVFDLMYQDLLATCKSHGLPLLLDAAFRPMPMLMSEAVTLSSIPSESVAEIIEKILLAIQKLHSFISDLKTPENCDDLQDGFFGNCQSILAWNHSFLKDSIDPILEAVNVIMSCVPDKEHVVCNAKCLLPFLEELCYNWIDGVLNTLVKPYGHCLGKFLSICNSLFMDLIQKGFCGASADDGEEGGQLLDNQDGVGIGEGSGNKDVSNEIENEDQVLGNNLESQAPDQPDNHLKEEKNAIEMDESAELDQTDQLYDPEENEDDEDEDDKDKDSETPEENDRMGETDGPSSEKQALDPELWDDESDDDEKDPEAESSKDDNDIVDQNTKSGLESEIVAKESSEDSKEPPKEDNNFEQQDQNDKNANQKEDIEEREEDSKNDDQASMDEDGTSEPENEIEGKAQHPMLDDIYSSDEDVSDEKLMDDCDDDDDGNEKSDDLEEEVKDAEDGCFVDPLDQPENPEDEKSDQKEAGEDMEICEEDKVAEEEKEEDDDFETEDNNHETCPDDIGDDVNNDSKDEKEMPVNGGFSQTKDQSSTGKDALSLDNTCQPNEEEEDLQDPMSQVPESQREETNVRTEQKADDLIDSVSENTQRKTQREVDAENGGSKADNPYRNFIDIMKKWHRTIHEIIDAGSDDEDNAGGLDDIDADESGITSENQEFQHHQQSEIQAIGRQDEDEKNLEEESRIAEELSKRMESKAESETTKGENELQAPLPLPKKSQPTKEQTLTNNLDDNNNNNNNNHELKDSFEDENAMDLVESESESCDESMAEDSRKRYPSQIPPINPDASLLMDFEDEIMASAKAKEYELQDDCPQPCSPTDHHLGQWQAFENNTKSLAMSLTEQLRLVLEPTLAARLEGDFRTGKRLNMKKIIPYIASDYRKDRIWLRRTKPSQREYQVLISVDDSQSMREMKATGLAFEALAMISQALTLLEVGRVGVVGFGHSVRLLKGLDEPMTEEVGSKLISSLTFKQQTTDLKKLLCLVQGIFSTVPRIRNSDVWQLHIVLSDGLCEDHGALRSLVRSAMEQRIMTVFVVLDCCKQKASESILNVQRAVYGGPGIDAQQLRIVRYMETFPFDFYQVVQDISQLPLVLCSAIRQWFELSSSQ